ncbi:unnamed protein product, partial [Rotaria sordida]
MSLVTQNTNTTS